MQMIIANTLADGFVVFLAADNSWTHDIATGAIAENEAAADELLAVAKTAEANNEVIDPYLIDVEMVSERPRPVEYREYIRAFGPSVPIPS